MTTEKKTEQVCCPRFEPSGWDDKTLEWNNKLFVRDKIRTFFFMPLNFGSVMRRIDKKIKDSGASVLDHMALSDHTSKWNMDIYIAVDKEVAGAENTRLNGNFYCKVYEGPFKDTGEWCKDYENNVKSKGQSIKKWYMWYTTCPKCAKKYGKNYVAIISELN
ncbi:MAG TPA: hydrolase [Bacteroidales bacterium]|nr:hydrolase [Bacteroidales bacterium]